MDYPPSTATDPDPVTARLEASRVDLLDLSLRNPLLNYRPSSRRGLEVIDERSTQLFSYLVVDGGALRIHHTKTASAERPEDDLLFLDGASPGPAQVGVGPANAPSSLATPYTKEILANRLLATASDAWLTIQEQGVNTLFLALGMLQWKEDGGEELRLAPLVLIPVRLERKSARSFWQLSAMDEDSGFNLSLLEKLKEYGIRLPAPRPPESVEELEALFGRVEQAVGERAGWSVARDRIAVGFFSFGKFLMYKDLDREAWPAGAKPESHPLLAAILRDGFREPPSSVPPGSDLDRARPSGRVMEVMDADGSQAEALEEVAHGRSLVIQGPPGTGKSQTISNLIAEAVSAGKRVLFVAEKLAALEVVKRRLERAGLGELCLELHSNKASKRGVAGELGRTLSLGRPKAGPGPEQDLADLRNRLNHYAGGVWAAVGSSECSPYQAIGILERLKALPVPLPKISCPSMADWTRTQYDAAQASVQDLAAKIGELGVPAQNPFEGCGLLELMPGDPDRIASALAEAREAVPRVQAAASRLAKALALPSPVDAAGLDALTALGALAAQAPDLKGLPPVGPEWDRADRLKALADSCERGLRRRTLMSGPQLLAHAWDADVAPLRGDLVSDGASWWRRLLSGRFKTARRAMQALCATPVPTAHPELILLADRILEARQLAGEIVERAPSVRALLGDRAAEPADWDERIRIRDWARGFRTLLGERKLPASTAAWVVGDWDRKELGAALADAQSALVQWRSAGARVRTGLAIPAGGRQDPEGQPFELVGEKLELWHRSLDRLGSYVSYWSLHEGVVRRGLGELALLAHAGTCEPGRLSGVLEQAWGQTLLDRALRERPELRSFDAVPHEQLVRRYCMADAAVFASNSVRLAAQHWDSLPGPAAYGQVGLLRRECAKKTRHLPIRQLMEQAGAAVQAAKPVFLMSPLSVAAYLPPGGPRFDLAVFDEASQVRPVDALGTVLRARQLVVVGDEKQLPPTSFFDTMVTTEGVTEGEEDGPGTNITQDMQSILGLCIAQGMPSRMLRWHYRSRHDSLIALSNHEFYADQLVVFPGPGRGEGREGLSFQHLPGSVYERGSTRTNPIEADAVAQAVLDHARTAPALSLGVVAFSQAQKLAVEHRIEILARKHADFDVWLHAGREEPFFIKNLENVQGDERDVILISVGYGRDARGAVSLNLGPLNQAGGERRLNVLITRARRRCRVFTNLTGDDIDLKRAGGKGIHAFKAFLDFAQSGRLVDSREAVRGAPEGFEAQVAAALRRAGYEVESQVGSGGYRLDLAVVDPRAPGHYLLGIACDGAGYQSARWTRDRDRLREVVLRGLGWSLHRVWSVDWHRHREEALRRCVAAIEASKKSTAPAAPAGPPAPQIVRSEERRDLAKVDPYVPANVGAQLGNTHLAELPTRTVAQFIAVIVEDESPIHVEEVRRRVLEALQARWGSRREAAIEEAIELAGTDSLIRRRGDFLWGQEDARIRLRDRSALPDASRRLEYVCDQECLAALGLAQGEACGCGPDEAATQAIRILGVKKSDEALERLRALLGTTPSPPR